MFFERDWPKFDQVIFILDYLRLHWENLIKSDNGNVDQSFDSFLTKFNPIYVWPSKNDFQTKTKI